MKTFTPERAIVLTVINIVWGLFLGFGFFLVVFDEFTANTMLAFPLLTGSFMFTFVISGLHIQLHRKQGSYTLMNKTTRKRINIAYRLIDAIALVVPYANGICAAYCILIMPKHVDTSSEEVKIVGMCLFLFGLFATILAWLVMRIKNY